MAAAAFAEEDDLLTCSVCWNIYDEEVHKPKFLSCHHTLCLECIKVLARSTNYMLVLVFSLIHSSS